MNVEIPFRDDMIYAVSLGWKCCTSRTKRYGCPGDLFLLHRKEIDMKFLCEIMGVVQLPLGFVAYRLYQLEGFGDEEDFINVWNELHPKKKYNPDQLVWVHFFDKVEQWTEK